MKPTAQSPRPMKPKATCLHALDQGVLHRENGWWRRSLLFDHVSLLPVIHFILLSSPGSSRDLCRYNVENGRFRPGLLKIFRASRNSNPVYITCIVLYLCRETVKFVENILIHTHSLIPGTL